MTRKQILVALLLDDYRRLVQEARREDRRVDQQASYLLKQALRQEEVARAAR